MRSNRRFAAQIVFYIGLLMMLLGAVFLLSFHFGISRLSLFSSCLILIVGVLCMVIAMKISIRPYYLFFASFFILSGLFLFLSGLGIIPVPLAQSWPVIPIFAGVSLIPAGLRHFKTVRIPYLIPALAFIILGSALIPFSFRLVSFSFRRFMIDWWPLVLVLAGLILVFFSLGTRPKTGE